MSADSYTYGSQTEQLSQKSYITNAYKLHIAHTTNTGVKR